MFKSDMEFLWDGITYNCNQILGVQRSGEKQEESGKARDPELMYEFKICRHGNCSQTSDNFKALNAFRLNMERKLVGKNVTNNC